MGAYYPNAAWLDVWGDPIKLTWFERYAWLPARSTYSGQWMWFKKYYAAWKKHPANYYHDADMELVKLTSKEYVWHLLGEKNA